MTDAPPATAFLPLGGVGEFVPAKQVWLLDNVEVVGAVESIGQPDDNLGLPDPLAADGDDFDIIPDPSYIHLIDHMRGNDPLMWKPIGTPRVLLCETYPMEAGMCTRAEPWPYEKKPVDAPFMVQLRNGTSRRLKVGDRVRVTGWWLIDHHPEFCDECVGFGEPSRCADYLTALPHPTLLRVGLAHAELHPFDWQHIRLVEPLRLGDAAESTVSLAAPLHEQQFLGTGKWLANGPYGGRVFLEPSGNPAVPYRNYHTRVRAQLDLEPPPRPSYPAALLYREAIRHLGTGMNLDATRTIELRQRSSPALTVRATIDDPEASILDPTNDRCVFQATYTLRWEKAQAEWRWCSKCQGLFYGLGLAGSRCPAGGTHADPKASRSGAYTIFYDAPGSANTQNQWRWCPRCQVLFYGPNWNTSRCPVGGTHTDPATSGSGNYTLLHGTATGGDLQPEWRWCSRCNGLFFGPNWGSSRCPVGGSHVDPAVSRSGNYRLLHVRQASGQLRAKVSPNIIGTGVHHILVSAVDSVDGRPIAGRVFLEQANVAATNTRFPVDLDPGSYPIIVRCPGHPEATVALKVGAVGL